MSQTGTISLPYTSRLRQLMIERLSVEDFYTLCFDLQFDHELLTASGKANMMREFLSIMKRTGRLAQVVVLCQTLFPANDWAQGPEEAYSTLEISLPKGSEGEVVKRGLEALSELMNHPAARTAVIVFRTDFMSVMSHIGIMNDYKQVHDLLHTLEYQCFAGLQRSAKLFPDDPQAADDLLDYELTLEQIIIGLRQLASQPTFLTNELAWVEDLERAQTNLHTAVAQEDARQLRHVIWSIGRIIAIQPAQINARLNAVARTLRLVTLVTAMTDIHETLAALHMDRAKLDDFVHGALSLTHLNDLLDELVGGHDRWQALILELRRIDTNMGQDPLELEMSWPDLQIMFRVLLGQGREASWVVELQKDIDQLDQSLLANNPALIRRYFGRIQSRSGQQFYRLDLELRRLCADLRRVGEPLATILKILD